MTSPNEPTAAERHLSSDKPILTAAQDRLGYAAFAQAIAVSIVNRTPSDGIVYAIHGPWGSGKTSAVNMLVEAVQILDSQKAESSRFITIRFNPWWFSEQSDLAGNFFSEVAAALDQKTTKKIADGLRKLGRQLTGARELLNAALSLVPGGAVASPLLKGAIDALQPGLADNESLDKTRQKLIDALREQKQRILVVIDDVDRLPADEIKQIFRLVKSVADLPNITYLLVFDREIARRAVGSEPTADGPEWIEKIVQASFDLPPVHAVDLRKMLIEGINKIIEGKDTGNSTRSANIMFSCVFPWIKTPRDVGRLLNAINVSLPPVVDDVNISNFIALETFRIFESRLFNFIRNQQERLTGVSDSGMKKDDSIGKELLEHVTNRNAEQVQEALQRLFPRLAAVWGNMHYGSDFVTKWDQNKQICAPRHFPTYFSYTTGDNALRSNEIVLLMESFKDISLFEKQIDNLSRQKRRNGTTKAALVLDTIQNKISDVPENDLQRCALTLLNSSHLLYPHHDSGQGFVDFPFTWNYWFTLRPILEKIDRKERAALISSAIDRSVDLVGLSFVVTAIEGEFGLHEGGEEKPPEARTVSDVELKDLQDKLVRRIHKMAENGELIEQSNLNILLLRWSESAGESVVRSWSNRQLDNESSAIKLAKSALSRGATHGSGDYVSTTYFRVDRDNTSKYIDVDALAGKLKNINDKTIGGVEIAAQFLKALTIKGRWDTGSDE